LTIKIDRAQPFPNGKMGFTVFNHQGKVAFTILCPNAKVHGEKVALLDELVKGTEWEFPTAP
jgi:hypothetical protein